MDGEAAAPANRPGDGGEQHGFRRAADGFAYPVPDDEHGCQGHPGGPGERRQRQQRDAHRRQHIAGHRESPVLPGAVRPGAEHQPESLGRGFRGAGHEADEQRGRTELGQQGTAERAGAVGHHVRGEADQAEADNRAPQPVPPIPGLASGPRRRVLLAGWHPAPGPFHFLRLTDGPEKDNTQVRGLSPRRGAEGNIGQRGSFWAGPSPQRRRRLPRRRSRPRPRRRRRPRRLPPLHRARRSARSGTSAVHGPAATWPISRSPASGRRPVGA